MKSIHSWQSVNQAGYEIVKAHGGEINVDSHEKAGTEFIIHLPMALFAKDGILKMA